MNNNKQLLKTFDERKFIEEILEPWRNKIVICTASEDKNGRCKFPKWKQQRKKFLYEGKITKQNQREVLPNEIIIEFDFVNVQDHQYELAKKEAKYWSKKVQDYLDNFGGMYWITDHGGKSSHVRFLIDGLENHEKKIRSIYKTKMVAHILKQIKFTSKFLAVDTGLNSQHPRLCSLETRPHFREKYNGNKVKIVKVGNQEKKNYPVDESAISKIKKSLAQDNKEINEIKIDTSSINLDILKEVWKNYVPGNRHNLIMALSGMFRRCNVPKTEAIQIFKTLMVGQTDLEQEVVKFSGSWQKAAHEVAVLYWLESFGENASNIYSQLKKAFGTNVDSKLNDPQLIEHIYRELDREHKLDPLEKLAVFVICISAELKDPADHVSAALKGDSSAGKDNLVKTCFKLFPSEDNFFLTRGTQSALEEEAANVKRLAFSEINKAREGANSELTEFFKQLSEGGVNVIKRDAATGYATNKQIETTQKSLFYGTTEIESDDELETRYVVIPVRGGVKKNQIVVNDVLDKARDENYWLDKDQQGDHWLAKSLKYFGHDVQVIIPFTHLFKQKITDEDGTKKYLFDFRKERIKRDAKRLMSLTRAVAWLHQKQRIVKEINGKKFLYAHPADFLVALRIFAGFFNLTYTGLDHREQTCLEKIKELEGQHAGEIAKLRQDATYYTWVLRSELQRELGISSRNTVKQRLASLKDKGLIETYWDRSNPKAYLISPVNSPVNDLSLPVSVDAIDRCLTGWLTPELTGKYYPKDIIAPDLSFIYKELTTAVYPQPKLTGQKLTGQKDSGIHTPILPRSGPLTVSEVEKIHHKCAQCNESPCVWQGKDGHYYCNQCVSTHTSFIKEEVVL